MSDLSKTDAEWLRLMREIGLFTRLARTLRENRRRYTREREQLRNINDFNSNFTVPHAGNTIAGVNYGTNTTEDGRVYVRIVANGGNWDVHLYTATGASGEVGRITNVAASATGTIVAQNSSGLTGSLRMAASVTAETDDVHQLELYPDWKHEALNVWPSDGTTDDDDYSRRVFANLLIRLDELEAQKEAALVASLEQFAIRSRGNPIARVNDFTSTQDTSLLSEVGQEDSSLAITRVVSGIWSTLEQAMADETTGSTQDITERVVAAAAGVFDGNNTGAGTVASHTPEQKCPVGTWTFTCVQGLHNGGGGTERFRVSFASSVDEETFTDSRLLTIGQSYKGPRGFGPITLVRSLTKTGDGSNLNLGAASTFTVTGENETNTGSGVLHWRINANGSNWDVQFYTSATSATNQTSGDLVAQATNVATSATSQQAAARNGSGLSITFDVGSGPTATTTGTLDLGYFTGDNASDVADKFTVATTLTSEGAAARVLAVIFQAQLNGISASPQIDDDILAGANTVNLGFMAEDM